MQKLKRYRLLIGFAVGVLVLAFSSPRNGEGGAAAPGVAKDGSEKDASVSAAGAVEANGVSKTRIANAGTAKAEIVKEGAVSAAGIATTGATLGWMSIGDATARLQKEKKPVLIDLYTTWCGWCKQMDRKTYSNKQVADYIQDKFYPVKVDAETHSVISWNGKEYRFNNDYRANDFAVYLTRGQLSFPTTIIIPPGGEPQAIPGYMEPKELELLVKYFGEGKNNKIPFEDFQKTFKPGW